MLADEAKSGMPTFTGPVKIYGVSNFAVTEGFMVRHRNVRCWKKSRFRTTCCMSYEPDVNRVQVNFHPMWVPGL